MSLRTAREVVAGKIEGPAGSAAATINPATDAILVSNPSFSYVDVRMLSRPVKKSTLGQLPQVYAGALVQLTFDVELKGSGTAGTPPELAHFLVACGMAEAIAPGVSVTYSMATEGQQYITLHYWQDGKKKVIEHAVGTASFNLAAGQFGIVSFTFKGHEGTEVDEVYPAAASYDATVPVPYKNAAFSIGGYAASVSAITFDLGGTLSVPSSVSSADGYGDVHIPERDIVGSLDPLDVLLATHDFVADWKAGTKMALDTGLVGSTAGNRYRVTMPAVCFRSVTQADREALRALDIAFGMHETSGDDQLSIVFT